MSRLGKASVRRPRASSGGSKTRQSLLDAALKLLDGERSLDGLSLRELTREVGIVPTAFYRHFKTMDELGLALVDDSFRALRARFPVCRAGPGDQQRLIRGVVKALVKQIRAQRPRFRFIASERHGGVTVVRQAIRREMRLVQSELAIDLSRFDFNRSWGVVDLQMLAALLVNAMVPIAEDILDLGRGDSSAEQELTVQAEQQLRLILLGAAQWKPASTSS